MITLNNGDRIDINRTVGTAYMAVVINYRRVSGSVFEPKVALSEVGGSGTVQALANSEPGYTYLIENIWIRSHSGTATMNVNFTVSGTPQATLYLGTVKRDEAVHYDAKKGFKKVSMSGAVMKIARPQIYETTVTGISRMASDQDDINNQAVANTLIGVDLASFWLAVPTGIYYVRAVFHLLSAATSTGYRVVPGLSDPGTSRYTAEFGRTATVRDYYQGLTANEGPAACNTGAVVAGNIAIIEGFLESTSPSGALNWYFASEVSNSAITAKAGSFFEIIQVV